MRWAVQEKGKRGGARVVYFYFVTKQRIMLLFAYPKSTKIDLKPAEIKQLKTLVKELS
jgi:hypothetical protein